MSERDLVQAIGPPDTPLAGMNTTLRRQQLQPNEHVMLRNLRLQGEAFTRVGGRVRILCGARRAKSLSYEDNAANRVEIPASDGGVAISEYDLPQKWSVFVSYRPDSLSTDVLVASHSDDAAPPWRITHNTNGTITVMVEDVDGGTAGAVTTTAYKAGRKVDLLLVRDGASISLIVNDHDAVTGTGLDATKATKTSSEDIYLAAWSGRASGSAVTYYEMRILRRADTSKDWRLTQYPYSGLFGDADLALHLLFDEGGGNTLTDYSRVDNGSITLEGAPSWNSTTERQVCEIVTGLHQMEKANGRKWLLCCVGRNYYRVPQN